MGELSNKKEGSLTLKQILENKPSKVNKRGQIGDTISLAVAVVILIVIGIVMIFAGLYVLAILNVPSYFAGSSLSANATQSLVDNTSRMVQNVSQQLPTLGTILGVVLILGAIVLILGVIVFFALRARQATNAFGGSTNL